MVSRKLRNVQGPTHQPQCSIIAWMTQQVECAFHYIVFVICNVSIRPTNDDFMLPTTNLHVCLNWLYRLI